MRIIKKIPFILLLSILWVSCTKVKEVPVDIQPPLEFPQNQLPSIEKIIGEMEGIEIYKEVYKKSGIKEFVDSVRTIPKGGNSPFTFFIPKDEAWIAKGYDLKKVQSLLPQDCKLLLKYLTVQGRFLPDSVMAVSGGISLFPILESKLFEYDGTFGSSIQPNYYSLNLAWESQHIYLNGNLLGEKKSIIFPASDGVVYAINKLIESPKKTIFQLLSEDPEYSFYLAALRISNRVYNEKMVGISPLDRSEELLGTPLTPLFNYYTKIKQFEPNNLSSPRLGGANLIFAPGNDAFIRNGLTDTVKIEKFIRKSYLTTNNYVVKDDRKPIFTNLDSALNYSLISKSVGVTSTSISFEYSHGTINLANQFVYLNDLRYNRILQSEGIRQNSRVQFYNWKYFDDNTWEFSVTDIKTGSLNLQIKLDGDKLYLQRADLPDGKKAYLVPDHSNITAFDGVVHRIDNLLLPNN